jgi:hypothetical protein
MVTCPEADFSDMWSRNPIDGELIIIRLDDTPNEAPIVALI